MEEKKLLNIQFFGENDEDMDMDDVAEDEVDYEDDNSDDEETADLNEGSDDEETESNEEDENQKQEQPTIKKQSREENAKYKELRKEAKRIQEETAKAKEQGKIEGIKIAFDNKNKFTGEPLEDDHDVKIFMMQLEMEKQGLDPIEDLPKYIAKQNREKEESVKKESKDKEWYVKDKNSFIEAYPDVELNELINDKDFQLFSKGKVGITPLKEIYADYTVFINKFNKKSEVEARKKVAKGMSSPKGVSSSEPSDSDYMSLDEIKKFSFQELQRLKYADPKKYEKIMASYDKRTKQ